MKYEKIEPFLKNLKSKKVVFLGLGNTLRSDDKVGSYIVNILKQKVKSNNYIFIDCGVTVENYLRSIIESYPDFVVFVDALRNGNFQEDYLILKEKDLLNYTFSTHNISVVSLIEYLKLEVLQKYNKMPEFYILGIKVHSLKIGEGLTEETKFIADNMVKFIYESLV
ncbi:MAG: hydrogenase maturation protease [Endomicrobia bacterium]|nr:hydrogenase maturation protease [Endomicrobiia bacterium]